MVLLIPYTDPARVQRARFLLAEVQGYTHSMAPTALVHATTRVTPQQWEHYLSHLTVRSQIRDGVWACVPVPARSEWCTLLLYGSEAYLFNRAGAACYFPTSAVKDRALFRGTVLAGDLTSDVQGETVVWRFRVVHALVVRGTLVVGIPLAQRHKAAERALAGLEHVSVGRGMWRCELAQLSNFSGFPKGTHGTALRLLHTQKPPDTSLLWALEFP
jgi:hypothetical protein